MIGVLVHVQRQDRDAAGDALGIVRRILIDQATIARHVGQQDPTDTAGQAARQRDELLAPTVD